METAILLALLCLMVGCEATRQRQAREQAARQQLLDSLTPEQRASFILQEQQLKLQQQQLLIDSQRAYNEQQEAEQQRQLQERQMINNILLRPADANPMPLGSQFNPIYVAPAQ
jgi:hypothetical protein